MHGLKGRNIPADLHQEHLNRVVKEAIRGLGANKTEAAITRVGRALGTSSPVLDQFEKENSVPERSGQHHVASSEKDRDTIVCQLQQTQVFTVITGRKHPTLPNPRDVMDGRTHLTMHTHHFTGSLLFTLCIFSCIIISD